MIKLNVGGKLFTTTRSTLTRNGCEENYFFKCKDGDDVMFIDRSPVYFEIILDYLRTNVLKCPENISHVHVYDEMDFYGIKNNVVNSSILAHLRYRDMAMEIYDEFAKQIHQKSRLRRPEVKIKDCQVSLDDHLMLAKYMKSKYGIELQWHIESSKDGWYCIMTW